MEDLKLNHPKGQNNPLNDETPLTQDELWLWYKITEELDALKPKEMALRKKIAKHYFSNPREGTNSTDLPNEYVMKMVHTINRKFDEGQLQANILNLVKANIPINSLIKREPTLIISGYRGLVAEQRDLVDLCLIATPGSPQLEIVLPKRKAKK